MERLESSFKTLISGNTEIFHDEPKFNAPHIYVVTEAEDASNELTTVMFQKGPIKEHGVNGVTNEDLIEIIIDRLSHFNQSEYSCRENAIAITKLEEALMWLNKRTVDRVARGVEGHMKSKE